MSAIGGINNFSNLYVYESQQVKKNLEITSYDFYHGSLDAIDCEALLRWKPTGTFLVRNAEKPNQFYLSCVVDSEQCHFEHIPFSLKGTMWIRQNLQVGKNENLIELIPDMMHRAKNECFPLMKDI